MTRILMLIFSLMLAGCASDEEDILGWMAEQEKTMGGGIKPLPEIQPFSVVEYSPAVALEPFATARLEPEKKAAAVGGPDLDRRREPLEAYPLESLQMVGVLMQGKNIQALVRADKSLYQVKVGNYLGQDFGVVTNVAESEVTLKELVEDLNGDWVERTSKLLLQERQEANR